MKWFPGRTYSLFLIGEFFKTFFASVVFILGLSFIVRTLQRLDSSSSYTFLQIITLRLLEAPEIISRETLLSSCMFASVYTMSNVSKNKEILALRSGGVSIYKIITPLIAVGLVICIGSLLFEDYIVVKSFILKDRYKATIKEEEQKDYYTDRRNVIVFGEGGVIYKIDRYHARPMEMEGVMIIKKDSMGNISYRIDAEKAKWDGKGWLFYKGILRTFNEDGGLKGRRVFSVFRPDIKDDPSYFREDSRRLENMTLKEGYLYVKMVKKHGSGHMGLLTRYNRKIANSFTLFIVIIIGLSPWEVCRSRMRWLSVSV